MAKSKGGMTKGNGSGGNKPGAGGKGGKRGC